MLTLSQLLILTERERSKFTRSYTLDVLKTAEGLDDEGHFSLFSAVVLGGSQPRKSVVRVYGEKVEAAADAKVSCSCAYFKIRLAIPLYISGTTDINVSRSEIPNKYRGLQHPGLCPHLLHLIEEILNSNSTKFRNLRDKSRKVSINDKLKKLV